MKQLLVVGWDMGLVEQRLILSGLPAENCLQGHGQRPRIQVTPGTLVAQRAM